MPAIKLEAMAKERLAIGRQNLLNLDAAVSNDSPESNQL